MDNSIHQKIAELYCSGNSMQQVADSLSVSFWKVKYSLEKQSIPRRNRSDASRLLSVTKFGKKEFSIKNELIEEEKHLKTAGIMLYWGEGTKGGNSVVFSNSDPDMIQLFLNFLRVICGIDEKRLRLLLHIYPDQNESKLKKFWSEKTKIPQAQFSKTFCHSGKNGTYKNLSPYGTISLRYSDKLLLNVINDWIKDYKLPI